jgi:23S rRNA pseudouridine1911/1915/1917 synthase
MPFVLKKFKVNQNEKIDIFLMKNLHYNQKNIQKLLDRGRVFDSYKNNIKKGQSIPTSEIYIALFEGITRGLKPLFQTQDFAIFDKPTKVMVHPISKYTPYSLLDEVKYHFSDSANIVHRIDAETSGLVLISKDKKSEIELKTMFERRAYTKKYLAIVDGKIEQSLTIDKPISKDTDSQIGVKMKVDSKGKESLTKITPIAYDLTKNQTLLDVEIFTGRQHQIRVHLYSIGHKIVGDPIYGVDENIADSYLNKTLSDEDRIKYTKANRLMLQANSLEFKYKQIFYKFYSKQKLL